MTSYRGSAGRPDKAKAVGAVIAVHAALAFVILSGLHVQEIRRAVDQMTTISIWKPPSPPRPPVRQPKPSAKTQAVKNAESASGEKAEPTPVVAPEPKLAVPSPVPAAKVGGTGTAASAGAAAAGNGTGAAGSGNGSGGGGTADYSRFTPARLVENIPNRAYSQLASTGIPSGLVGVVILVSPNGSVSNCRIARSSGDPLIDSLVCQLTVRYVRFDPARDPYGRAVAQDITYFPNWRRR